MVNCESSSDLESGINIPTAKKWRKRGIKKARTGVLLAGLGSYLLTLSLSLLNAVGVPEDFLAHYPKNIKSIICDMIPRFFC